MEVDLGCSHLCQDRPGKIYSLRFIGIGIRPVDLCGIMLSVVEMIRLDDNAAEREDFTTAINTWANSVGFITKCEYRSPVSKRFVAVRIDVIG